MTPSIPAVIVIDDDPAVREALDGLFRSVGLRVVVFKAVADFLNSVAPDGPCCLVLDVRLPGRSGLDLQEELTARGIPLPIIFITGHGDIPMSVRAMKAGAIEFLPKPFRDQDLLDAIRIALDRDSKRRLAEEDSHGLRSRFDQLSPREQQIMGLVAAGLMNKQIAHEVGLSEVTVKVHRGQVMKKMAAHSLADLVRMADRLGQLRGGA